MPISFLARKLQHGANLVDSDVDRIDQIVGEPRDVLAGQDLFLHGDHSAFVHVMNSGTACRYKMLPDGSRAIVALMLPGDFCDLHISILAEMDHSMGAVSDCTISRISSDELDRLLDAHPRIKRACIWSNLVDEAILREWLVNIGRRSSDRRLAHLFCELYLRLNAVGLTEDHTFHVPLTQPILADLLGITPVHVQRTLASLRRSGLVSVQGGYVRIPDFAVLEELAGFDRTYLHLPDMTG